jgi:outer membrane beta-barrel protein
MARMAKKLLKTLPALLVLAAIGTTTNEASAQEIQLTGPLKGAPAVRRLKLYREGRFEVAPVVSFTILDEYRRTIIVGARLNYGIKDWLSIGLWGGFGAVGIATGLTEQIDQNAKREGLTQMNVPGQAGKTGPTDTGQGEGNFQKQVAQIGYIAMPQITAVPFRGKFALFQSVFADVDAYIFAGFGVVGTKERKACGDFVACANQDEANRLESKNHLAPTWGLGFNFYLSKFMSFGLEYRMIPFAWNRSGFDTRGLNANGEPDKSGKFPDQKIDDTDSTYRFNQMISLSIGFSFPTLPTITD